MLESFSVTNFRNFKDTITLDLKAANYNFNSEIVNENKILNFSMIYGDNACGKSNLVLAIFDIVNTLTDKNHLEKKPFENYGNNYQNAETKNKLTEFIYKFDFDGNTLVYKYSKNHFNNIRFEELTINDKVLITFDKSKGPAFEQNFSELKTLKLNIENKNLSAVKYLYSNSQLDENKLETQTFNKFMHFVNKMLLFWSLKDKSYLGYRSGSPEIIKEIINNDWVDKYNDFLKLHSINKQITVQQLPDGSKAAYYDFGNNNLLPLSENMSTGENSLLLFFYWCIMCNNDNPPTFICIDEFDAFYHINLSKKIVQTLKNMKNIQIIITSHNSNLISNEMLRPDAYFLLQKGRVKSFNNLTEKELRQAHNLERMFKAGTFNLIEN